MTATKTEPVVRLPASLQLHDVPLVEALTGLATLLADLAEHIHPLTDLECIVAVDPDGRTTLRFRAC
ncbi:hypothetical protein [Sinorhizobium medicae]|uniref:hypothetical protein n=1 Tax=Sinorhizobium medicae TaxID=110321 RepID=UPI000FD76C88|nr:hypothetical protein [Sinorhizobium medicae]RVJ23436.1 hypothetical protein CN179_24775 [Sinorhizobium medicae]